MGASLLAVAKSIYYELFSLIHGVDICLSYNTAHSKKKKKQLNKIQENKEGEPRNKRSQYKVRCFIELIVLKTN